MGVWAKLMVLVRKLLSARIDGVWGEPMAVPAVLPRATPMRTIIRDNTEPGVRVELAVYEMQLAGFDAAGTRVGAGTFTVAVPSGPTQLAEAERVACWQAQVELNGLIVKVEGARLVTPAFFEGGA